MKTIFFTILTFVLSSLNSFSQENDSKIVQQYQRIYQPDSLLTKSDLELKYKLYDLIVENILFDGKKVYTNLKESDFKNINLPVYYYHDFIKNLDEINQFIGKSKNFNSKEMQESVSELRQQYMKVQKDTKKEILTLPCKSFSQNSNPVDNKAEINNRIFLPDSLLTKDELKLKYLSGDLVFENLYLDGNTICTRLTENDFVKNNIPVYYYQVLIQNIKDVNEYNIKNKINRESISKLMNDAKTQYLKNKPKL